MTKAKQFVARMNQVISMGVLSVTVLKLSDHGNHTEDSPFLSTDAAGKKNEFYDRNLALFEVCLFWNFSYLLLAGDGTKPIH